MDIPQVIAIVSITPEGRLNLKKDVRMHLSVEEASKGLFLTMEKEIVLSVKGEAGLNVSLEDGNKVVLPREALKKLEISGRSLVALVQREKAVSIKKFEVKEEEGDLACIADLETAYKITRRAETNLMPDQLIPKLLAEHKTVKLKYDAKSFLKDRETLEAWKARQLLGISKPSDETLRKKLMRKIVERQGKDGSWEGKVAVTARKLRELAELGKSKDDKKIQRAINWLLKRPQSTYNPGMFFLKDDLVKEQKEIIKIRETQTRGSKMRFRKRLVSEAKLVKAGDDLIQNPCGPRIMWPNALALEALLKLGLEKNERVQKALRTLMLSRWCECAFQHGTTGFKRKKPYTLKEIEEFKQTHVNEYRYGGLSSLQKLEEKDMAHKVGTKMPRISHSFVNGGDKYLLRMHDASPDCAFITVRALSEVTDKKLRKLVEAGLWRFAGLQHSKDGRFSAEYETFDPLQIAFLQLFSRFNHPASKVAILRSIPWIVENQNEDGSWGDGVQKDSSTLTVIESLYNVGLLRFFME